MCPERTQGVTQDDGHADQGDARGPKIPALTQKARGRMAGIALFVRERAGALRISCWMTLRVRTIVDHESSPCGKHQLVPRKAARGQVIAILRRTGNEAVCILSKWKLSQGEAGGLSKYSARWWRSFHSRKVKARHSLANGAQQVRGDSSKATGNHVRRVYVFSVGSVDCGHVSDGNIGDFSNVE